MADNAKNTYPLLGFRFSVTVGTMDNIRFSEASGLTQECQVIEYRDTLMNKKDALMKIPGLRKWNNITLKRGIINDSNKNIFLDWLEKLDRRDIKISLVDETGNPLISWSVQGAFPVKVEGPQLKASGNEIAIESIEIAHEGFKPLVD
jgi:phage tail-like protein